MWSEPASESSKKAPSQKDWSQKDALVVKDGAEEVGVKGHGFGKGIVPVAGDEQVVFLAAELCIATGDHPAVGEYLECRGSAVAQERYIAPLV